MSDSHEGHIPPQMRERFLNPAETNRSDLLDAIETGLAFLPHAPTDNAGFLGTPGNYGWLSEFEEIPEFGEERKTVMSATAGALEGTPRWHSPGSNFNILPPPMIDPVAATAVANLYNPMSLHDLTSGGLYQLQQQMVRQLSRLIGWSLQNTDPEGVFTYGGKSCYMYAMRLGLKRCLPQVVSSGLSAYSGPTPVIIASKQAHYTIEGAAALLGLGTDAVKRVDCGPDGSMDLAKFAALYERLVEQGRPIAAIIANGGETINLFGDPANEIARIIDEVDLRHDLSYRPFLYADTVISWAWLFFRDYDFAENPMGLSPAVSERIERITTRVCASDRADAFGVDFHKVGFAPYQTSMFMIREAAELHSLNQEHVERMPRQPHGGNEMYNFMFEHSVGAAPVVSAWAALQSAGVNGFRSYIAQMLTVTDAFRQLMPSDQFELINPNGASFASCFWPLMPGGPASLGEAVTSSPAVIAEVNKYTFELVNAMMDPTGEHGLPLFVGFVPRLAFSQGREQICGIRLHPMSAHSSVESAAAVRDEIVKRKAWFDSTDNHQSVDRIQPVRVPM